MHASIVESQSRTCMRYIPAYKNDWVECLLYFFCSGDTFRSYQPHLLAHLINGGGQTGGPEVHTVAARQPHCIYQGNNVRALIADNPPLDPVYQEGGCAPTFPARRDIVVHFPDSRKGVKVGWHYICKCTNISRSRWC